MRPTPALCPIPFVSVCALSVLLFSGVPIEAHAIPGVPKGLPKPPKVKKPKKGERPSTPGPEPEAKPAVAAEPTVDVPAMKDAHRVPVAEGARTIAPAAPTFCRGDFRKWSQSSFSYMSLDRILTVTQYRPGATRYDPLYELYRSGTDLARLACTYPKNREVQAWVASYRQILENELRAPDAVIDEALAQLLTLDKDRVGDLLDRQKSGCGTFVVPEDAKGPSARMRVELICGKGEGWEAHYREAPWLYDGAGEPESALDRAAYLSMIVGGSQNRLGFDVADMAGSGKTFSRYLLVRTDLRDFDRDAVLAEVGAGGLEGFSAVHAQLRVYDLERRVRRTRETVDAAVAKEPALVPILEAADRAAEAWAVERAEHAELWERAQRFEQGWLYKDRAVVDACLGDLGADFSTYARSMKPASKADIHALTLNSTGYMIASAAYRCATEHEETALQGAMARLLHPAPALRGPRADAIVAAMRVVAEQRADGDAPYDPKDMVPFASARDTRVVMTRGLQDSEGSRLGVVSGVRPDGEAVVVEFSAKSARYPVLECVETGIIDGFWMDGSIRYRQKCKVVGYKTETTQIPAVRVRAADAVGIQAGRSLAIRTRKDGFSVPLEAYADAEMTRISAYLGVALPTD